MTKARLDSIDFVRGLVMVIMALDHVRDLMHVTSLTQDPTDMATTTPALFFTRWITHFCAPIFVFLAGTSAYLSTQKENDVAVARRFVWRRGIWLVMLEFTLVNFALWFDLKFRTFMFQVIAAIGCSFILLALMLKWSARTIGWIGAVIVAGHNILPLLPLRNDSPLRLALSPLFSLTVYPLTPNLTLIIAYPLIPWLGILLLGYAAGTIFERSESEQRSLLLKIGSAALLLFTVLRFLNVYGDPAQWSGQRNAVFTLLSFLNITKYPPSLLFTLLTLGVMFLVLAFAGKLQNLFSRVIIIYGRVPLLYYLLHFYLIHILMFGMVFAQGYGWSDLVFGFNFGRPKEGSGVSLMAIYAIWLGVVAMLYPTCRWYAKYKAEHRDNEWLRYL
jgi:uncharacterized membrane protein